MGSSPIHAQPFCAGRYRVPGYIGLVVERRREEYVGLGASPKCIPVCAGRG